MSQVFKGVLRGRELSAACIVSCDSDGAAYLNDVDVSPRLPDGEYDLVINGVQMHATRKDSVWTASDY